MLGIDEFSILLVLDDIGGSNVTENVVKNFEKFLRAVHIYDEKFLNLSDIQIQDRETIYVMFSENNRYYFKITSSHVTFFRNHKESYDLLEGHNFFNDEDSFLLLFRQSIYLYCVDNKLDPVLYYPNTEGEILCSYDGV